MRARQRPRRAIAAAVGLLAGSAALVLLTLHPRFGADAELAAPIHGRPLALEIPSAESFEQFVLGLRVEGYRARRRDRSVVRDTYLDTPGWALRRLGYACRLRATPGDDEVPTYRLRLQPPVGTAGGLALDAPLPQASAERVLSSEWSAALDAEAPGGALQRLRERLDQLGVAHEQLAPRLVGRVELWRFDLTDRGRTWFHLEREDARFRAAGSAGEKAESRTHALALAVANDAPADELFSRARTMHEFVRTFYPFRESEALGIDRAVEALGLS